MISIIVRTYNRKKFLPKTLESIKNQTYKNYEIILVDDGSIDNTLELADNIKSINIIKNKHRGRTHALNVGIKSAKGDYIAFLDDDDLWKPEFLSTSIFCIENNPDAAIVFTDFRYFYDHSENIFYSIRNKISETSPDNNKIIKSLIYANFIPPSTVLIKKRSFDIVGLFDEKLNTHEDWDMWLRFSSKGLKFIFINKNLALLRKHKNNITNNMNEMFAGALEVLKKNRKTLDQSYSNEVNSSIIRISNILSVIFAISGDKLAAKKMLCNNFKKQNYKTVPYIIAVYLLPSFFLKLFVSLYSRFFVILRD